MFAWLQLPNIQDWAGSVIDDVVAYGKGSDTQILASKLLHSYSESGFMGTLAHT